MPEPDTSPDDIAALRAALAAEQLARREAEARASGAEAMVAHLKLLIARLKRDKYGASSERGRKLLDQLELELGELVAAASEDAAKAEDAAHLVRSTALAEGIHARAVRPVLHGDNGPSVKGTTVLAMLSWLGIAPSHSRPRVSDDNAYAEALFRTAKYRPDFPNTGFADLAGARRWAAA